MRSASRNLVRVGALVAAVAMLAGATALAITALHAGPQGDGTGVTPAGWRTRRAGPSTSPTATATR